MYKHFNFKVTKKRKLTVGATHGATAIDRYGRWTNKTGTLKI
jgi:hypothetical protein